MQRLTGSETSLKLNLWCKLSVIYMVNLYGKAPKNWNKSSLETLAYAALEKTYDICTCQHTTVIEHDLYQLLFLFLASQSYIK